MAPNDGTGPARRRPRVRQINVAHFGMGVLFLTWLAFQITLGNAAPGVLDVLLGSIGGIWFGMVVREQGRRDEAQQDRVTRAEDRVGELERQVNDAE